MAIIPKSKILVDLDSILDTRIATIAKISDELAVSVLSNNYHTRTQDVFDHVDMDRYIELYKNRDVDTLKLSTITNMVPVLARLSYLLTQEAIYKPYHSGPEITINTYPYRLSEAAANQFVLSLNAWMDEYTPISTTMINPAVLTPAACDEYSLLIMYDPSVWLSENLELLMKKPIMGVALYTPEILHNPPKNKEEYDEIIAEIEEPFRMTEVVLKALVDINMLDINYFSVVRPGKMPDLSRFRLHTENSTNNPSSD